jgi:hypothetical protein
MREYASQKQHICSGRRLNETEIVVGGFGNVHVDAIKCQNVRGMGKNI